MQWRFIELFAEKYLSMGSYLVGFFFILRYLFCISVCCGFPHPQIYFSVAGRKQEGKKKQASRQKAI